MRGGDFPGFFLLNRRVFPTFRFLDEENFAVFFLLARGIFTAFGVSCAEKISLFFSRAEKTFLVLASCRRVFPAFGGLVRKDGPAFEFFARRIDFEERLTPERLTRVARLLPAVKSNPPPASESTANERKIATTRTTLLRRRPPFYAAPLGGFPLNERRNGVKFDTFCLFSVPARRVVEVSRPTQSFSRRPLDFRRSQRARLTYLPHLLGVAALKSTYFARSASARRVSTGQSPKLLVQRKLFLGDRSISNALQERVLLFLPLFLASQR